MSQNAESVEKKEEATKSQQQKSNPEGHGFTEATWVVASKIDDSYTKREVATVQGANNNIY